jgi:RNA polymerase sigma factor (sigma-70 family)
LVKVRSIATETAPPEAQPAAAIHALLVERAQAADVQAWSRLYQEHFDGVFRHVRFLTGDDDLAEDLTQETFAKAMTSIASFRGQSSFSTWLGGIAINVVREQWRWQRNTRTAHGRMENMQAVEPQADGAPERVNLQKTRAKVLYTILEGMPAGLREIFVLRDLQGMPAREIAAQLGISEGNVAVRATRARARVRAELERLGWLSPRQGA